MLIKEVIIGSSTWEASIITTNKNVNEAVNIESLGKFLNIVVKG